MWKVGDVAAKVVAVREFGRCDDVEGGWEYSRWCEGMCGM